MRKFVSYFTYSFVGMLACAFLISCESDNADNPLRTSQMQGYFGDSLYWNTFSPSVIVSTLTYTEQINDSTSVTKTDTVMNIRGTSELGNGTISIFIPQPKVGSFEFVNLDSVPDSVQVGIVPFLIYDNQTRVGSINITRYDTSRYILEADIEFEYTFPAAPNNPSDSVPNQPTEGNFKGKIKSVFLNKW